MEKTSKDQNESSTIIITPEAMLSHWQGHRGLTRKVIVAFPEDKLFNYSVGGMRPFSDLAFEMIGMAVQGVKGVATGQWEYYSGPKPTTREELLRLWDEQTEPLNTAWRQIPPHRFLEVEAAFGQWTAPLHVAILYWIDNEIHHRGQGYVYLRSLGIEPPAFWDR